MVPVLLPSKVTPIYTVSHQRLAGNCRETTCLAMVVVVLVRKR